MFAHQQNHFLIDETVTEHGLLPTSEEIDALHFQDYNLGNIQA